MANYMYKLYTVKHTINSVNQNTTDLDFNWFLKDIDNGDVIYNNVSGSVLAKVRLSSISLNVRNVKKDQTVSCNVNFLGMDVPWDYTSKYEDTITRPIFKEINDVYPSTDFVNSLRGNGGKLRMSIKQPSNHFYGDIDMTIEFFMLFSEMATSFSVNGRDITNNIRCQLPTNANGCRFAVIDKTSGSTLLDRIEGRNYVDIPPGTITSVGSPIEFRYYPANKILSGESFYSGTWKEPTVTYPVVSTVSDFTVSPPTIEGLSYHGDLWEKPISISWRSQNQAGYEWEAYYNNVVVGSGSGGSETGFNIPAETFKGTLSSTVRVRVYRDYGGSRYYSGWREISLRLLDIEATISNLLVQGDMWEYPILLSWQSENQQQFKVEVFKGNTLVKTYTGTTSKSFSIPAGELSNGSHTFKVWVGYANRLVNNQSRNVTLKDITATISNLLIEGDLWEKPIKVSWQSTNQQQFKLEVLKSNVVVKTYTGSTATNYTIPAEALGEGQYTIRVTVAYANRYVNSADRSVSFKNILATLSNIALSGSNIDLQLLLNWDSTDQQKYEVEIYKGDSRVKSYSGTTAKSLNIPNNTLTTGLHEFRVRVAYKDRWTEWKKITSTLIETLPSIGILEPDGVITERDNPTRIWWTSQNQSKWKLVIDEATTYTGTTEKEKILPAGALQTGQHSIVLTVWYVTSLGVEKPPVTKRAEWIVQGKPPTPTITSNSSFATNRPVITWDTQDQQGYILEVLKYDVVIYSTDQQNGLIVEHKIKDYLENGTYTVRVKVMNQYSLDSDWGTKQITINGQFSADIKLNTLLIKDTVRLKWDNPNNSFTKFYIMRNDIVIGKTTGEEYADYTAFGDCKYKIRGVTVSDVYVDSNLSYERCDIKYGLMATIDALNDTINVGLSRDEFSFNGSMSLESDTIMLSGRELPVTVFGEHSTNTFSLNFIGDIKLKLLSMCEKRVPFLYRDDMQKLYLTITSPAYKRDKLGLEYSVQALEVDYSEVVEYD